MKIGWSPTGKTLGLNIIHKFIDVHFWFLRDVVLEPRSLCLLVALSMPAAASGPTAGAAAFDGSVATKCCSQNMATCSRFEKQPKIVSGEEENIWPIYRFTVVLIWVAVRHEFILALSRRSLRKCLPILAAWSTRRSEARSELLAGKSRLFGSDPGTPLVKLQKMHRIYSTRNRATYHRGLVFLFVGKVYIICSLVVKGDAPLDEGRCIFPTALQRTFTQTT